MLTLLNNNDNYDLYLEGKINIPTKLNYNKIKKIQISETLNTILKNEYITINYDYTIKYDNSFNLINYETLPKAYNIEVTEGNKVVKYNYKNAFNGIGTIAGTQYKIYSQYTNGNTFFLEEYIEPTLTNTTGTSGNSTSTTSAVGAVGGYKKNKKSRKTSKHKSRKNKNSNSKYKLHNSKRTKKYKNKNRNTKKN